MYTNNAQQNLFPYSNVKDDISLDSHNGENPSEVVYSISASDSISLRVLFLRHMKQQRWIYFLNQDLSLKTNNYPVLQVKLNQQQSQFDAIEKIVSHGQTGAIIVEQPKLTQEQIALLKLLCKQKNVILILLENHFAKCH